MKLSDINVPLTYLIAAIVFTVSSVITVEFRYAKAASVSELNKTVQVTSRENRLLMLQMQMFQAKTEQERQFLQAQIDQLLRELDALRDE